MWQRSAIVLIVDKHSVDKHLQRSNPSAEMVADTPAALRLPGCLHACP